MDVGEPIQGNYYLPYGVCVCGVWPNNIELGDSSKIAPDSPSEYCDIVIKAPCCTKECLRSRLPVNKSFLLVKGCLEEVSFRFFALSTLSYLIPKFSPFQSRSNTGRHRARGPIF